MKKADEVLLRTSERTTYKRCRMKWKWAYVDHLTAREVKPALTFGTLVHQSLAAYYPPGTRRGPHPAETFVKLYNDPNVQGFNIRQEDSVWVDAEELGLAMLENYTRTYGSDKRYRVLAPEQPFQVRLYNPKSGRYMITGAGILDAIIEDLQTGLIGVLEHKTAKTISTRHLGMDEQGGSYWALGSRYLRQRKVIPEDKNLDFVLYNFLRKAKPDARPTNVLGQHLNKDGSVSKVQPSPYFLRHPVFRGQTDMDNLIKRVIYEAWEIKQARAGKLPIYKNPTRDCSWDCEFFDMCELHETGGDWKELRRMTMERWDPYEEHICKIGVDRDVEPEQG